MEVKWSDEMLGQMKIVFGMDLDGASWSGETSVNQYVCGPLGMLKFLETRLGLTGCEVPEPVRIADIRDKLERDCPKWCKVSFSRDPWNTAARVLQMRDELVMMGWKGTASPRSERMNAIRTLELTEPKTLPGLADRLWRIASAEVLADDGITVSLIGNVGDYPLVWRKILDRHFGGRCRSELAAVAEKRPRLTIVRAPDEARLAVDLVRYLKCGDNGRVAIIADGDTSLLDEVLARNALPRIGRSSTSVYRECLEALPLWIENLWAPFSPRKFIELLSLRFGPVPRWVARPLIAALNEHPGVGGEKWDEAWREIDKAIDDFKDFGTGEALSDEDKAKKRDEVSRLRSIFEMDRLSPETGMPKALLAQIMDELDRKLRTKLIAEKIDAERGDHAYSITTVRSQIERLRSVVSGFAGDRIPKVQLERMLSSVMGSGIKQEDVNPEVSNWTAVKSPGQIVDVYDVVIWWQFVGGKTHYQTKWLKDELSAVTEDGGEDDSVRLKRRELASWKMVLSKARAELICLAPQKVDGEIAPLHPFCDNIVCEYGKQQVKDCTFESVKLCSEQGHWSLADRECQLDKALPPRVIDKRKALGIKSDAALTPRNMSASQLEKLVSCPFAWYLDKVVELRDADVSAVLSDPLIKGKLAHKVLELLWREHPASSEAASSRAGVLFDELVPKMAATYAIPEKVDAKRIFRRKLMDAVRVLFDEVKSRNLTWVESEKDDFKTETFDVNFKGVPFIGSVDLVLKDADGNKFIVDYKWSKDGKHYIDDAKKGRSVQLASYDWLISAGAFGSKTAYYILPAKNFFEGKGQDDADVWNRVSEEYDRCLTKIRNGKFKKGIPESEMKYGSTERNDHVAQNGVKFDKASSCFFCPYKVFCGEVIAPNA